MTDAQARARVWTLCLAALLLAALTGPVAALLTPLAHASAPALTILAAALAAALIGAYVALAVLLIVAVLRVVCPPRTATASPPGSALASSDVALLVRPGASDRGAILVLLAL